MFTLTKTQRHANDINDWYDALFSYETTINASENATESTPRLLHCRLHDLNWFHFFRLHFFRLHFMVFIAFSVSPPNFSPLEVYACRSQQLSCQSVDKILSSIAQVSSLQSLLRIKLCQSTFMLPKVLLNLCPKFCSTCATWSAWESNRK